MAAPRRVGAENSATRALILDATEHVLVEEGYAAASTRRVAARAGLKPSLVHYYFPTTDDLLIAVYRRAADWSTELLDQALADPDPLMALWNYTIDTTRTALVLEFMALATHRKALQAEMKAHSGESHAKQLVVLERVLGDRAKTLPPQVLANLISGVGRMMVLETGTGVSDGHAAMRVWFEAWLGQLAGNTPADAV